MVTKKNYTESNIVSEAIADGVKVRTTIMTDMCEIYVEEFYRLMWVIGHIETFNVRGSCYNIEPGDLHTVNEYLQQLNPTLSVQQ